MALIKREIFTSREVLYAKLVLKNQFLFNLQKRCFPKKGLFSLKILAQAKRNWHSMFLKIFQVLTDYEMVNKVNLSSFSTQNLFQIRACAISTRKAKHLDVKTMFTYSHANTPLGQSDRAYYLSYFQKILLLQKPCRHLKVVVKVTPQSILWQNDQADMSFINY